MNIVWGGKVIPDLQNNEKPLGEVIGHLDTDGSFERDSIMTVTFSYVGGH